MGKSASLAQELSQGRLSNGDKQTMERADQIPQPGEPNLL